MEELFVYLKNFFDRYPGAICKIKGDLTIKEVEKIEEEIYKNQLPYHINRTLNLALEKITGIGCSDEYLVSESYELKIKILHI